MRRFDGFDVQISRFECQILECFKKERKGQSWQGLKDISKIYFRYTEKCVSCVRPEPDETDVK